MIGSSKLRTDACLRLGDIEKRAIGELAHEVPKFINVKADAEGPAI